MYDIRTIQPQRYANQHVIQINEAFDLVILLPWFYI